MSAPRGKHAYPLSTHRPPRRLMAHRTSPEPLRPRKADATLYVIRMTYTTAVYGSTSVQAGGGGASQGHRGTHRDVQDPQRASGPTRGRGAGAGPGARFACRGGSPSGVLVNRVSIRGTSKASPTPPRYFRLVDLVLRVAPLSHFAAASFLHASQRYEPSSISGRTRRLHCLHGDVSPFLPR
jgi:hypothetical protein